MSYVRGPVRNLTLFLMGRDILPDHVIPNFQELMEMLKNMPVAFLMVLVVAFFLRALLLVTILLFP